MSELDYRFYEDYYPDLKIFNGDPVALQRHWTEHGSKEARFPNKEIKELYDTSFVLEEYLLNRPELKDRDMREVVSSWVSEQMSRLRMGVNIFNPHDDTSGLGVNGPSIAKALDIVKVPYVINNKVYRVSVLNHDASDGRWLDSDTANVCIWAWETEITDIRRRGLADKLHEIWAISEFCQREAGPKAVTIHIPPLISSCPKTPEESKEQFGLKGFVCLFIFDYGSCHVRKNPQAVIEAFKRAFGDRDDVFLVIKGKSGNVAPTVEKEVRESMPKNSRYITDVYSKEETISLINACDVYISLHRSEGSGLTMLEAMFLGKPVIATGYSGNLDFMDDNTALLVDWTYCPVGGIYEERSPGARWAEPNIDTASSYLRLLYKYPEIRSLYSKRAKEYVTSEWTHEKLGILLKDRITKLYQRYLPSI